MPAVSPGPSVPVLVNEILLDQAIMHAIQFERLKAGEVRALIEFLNDEVLSDLLDQIERRLANISARGFDTGIRSTKRLLAMSDGIRQIIRSGYLDLYRRAGQSLDRIASLEAQWVARTATEALPLSLNFSTPAVGLVRAVVTKRPVLGQVIREFFKAEAESTIRLVESEITKGLTLGESVPTLVSRLRGTRANAYKDGVLNRPRNALETVVRTAASHVSSQAREQTYLANEELISGVLFVATLDDRTTIQCAVLDGKVFPIGEGPRPPIHPRCRSTTIPVLRSWREVGLTSAGPEVRASMDGKVPGSLTFSQWLRKQSVERQENVLGVTRAKLFRGNRIAFSKFTDETNRVLTIDELARTYGISV